MRLAREGIKMEANNKYKRTREIISAGLITNLIDYSDNINKLLIEIHARHCDEPIRVIYNKIKVIKNLNDCLRFFHMALKLVSERVTDIDGDEIDPWDIFSKLAEMSVCGNEDGIEKMLKKYQEKE
jgi:hypothetical protein